MLPTPCIVPRCTHPAIAGASRCSKHRNSGRRGPNPYDANHQAIAKQVLASATRCAICGKPPTPSNPLQADHIVPLSEGGQTVRSNYQAAHRRCNIRKGGTNRK